MSQTAGEVDQRLLHRKQATATPGIVAELQIEFAFLVMAVMERRLSGITALSALRELREQELGRSAEEVLANEPEGTKPRLQAIKIIASYNPAAQVVAQEDWGLTDREFGILKLLAEGMSNIQISQRLWIVEHTVKYYLTNIYRKLGVANRTEAARKYMKLEHEALVA